MHSYKRSVAVDAAPAEVFLFIDDHARFSSHMTQPSRMMGGGRMEIEVDKGGGQEVGSQIRMSGSAFGIKLTLDEVVTEYQPPRAKAWKTVGNPNLLIIGAYSMRICIEPKGKASSVSVSIEYELPQRRRWLGRLFAPAYARWCVGQMAKGITKHFDQSH